MPLGAQRVERQPAARHRYLHRPITLIHRVSGRTELKRAGDHGQVVEHGRALKLAADPEIRDVCLVEPGQIDVYGGDSSTAEAVVDGRVPRTPVLAPNGLSVAYDLPALMGYDAAPAGMQVLFYVVTALVILSCMWRVRRMPALKTAH